MNNPSILKYIESFEDEKSYYIVMKYMSAGDLYKYIKIQGQPLDENHVKLIIRQVAKGIQALHSRLIIHRDIKCENILVTDYSRDTSVRIADFGSAVQLESTSDTADFIIGTPGYTAPEVMRGKRYSLGCDIWSIGALMHMLLSFKAPFINDDHREYKYRAITEPLDLETDEYLRQLSDPAKDLLRRMLEKDPRYRSTIEQVLAHEWLL